MVKKEKSDKVDKFRNGMFEPFTQGSMYYPVIDKFGKALCGESAYQWDLYSETILNSSHFKGFIKYYERLLNEYKDKQISEYKEKLTEENLKKKAKERLTEKEIDDRVKQVVKAMTSIVYADVKGLNEFFEKEIDFSLDKCKVRMSDIQIFKDKKDNFIPEKNINSDDIRFLKTYVEFESGKEKNND